MHLNNLRAFSVDDVVNPDSWKPIKENCPALSDLGVGILSEPLAKSLKTVILEDQYICKDHRNLYSNYYSKKFGNVSKFCKRLHFFSKEDIRPLDLMMDPEKYQDDYIGYSVIRPLPEVCLGRTVIDPLKLNKFDPNNFFSLRTNFSAHINGRKFTVCGYPYTSQDADVTVCAHASLWGVCRYLSERYSIYAETYPYDFINMTETSRGRTFPYRGMTYSDYCTILSEFGSFPILLQLRERPSDPNLIPEAFQDLYTYVESGFPVLASFGFHVVSIIGHTIDYDKPVDPGKPIIDSSHFLKQFIIVDDNFFPYQLLGHQTDSDNYGNAYLPHYLLNMDKINHAVCPMPEKVYLPSEKVRKYIIPKIISRFKSQLEAISSGQLITRLLLATCSSFKKRKLENIKSKGIDQVSFFTTTINLPHFIWLLEISTVDLYKRGKIICEILIDPTTNVNEDSFLYIRIGNKLIYDDKAPVFDDQPKEFEQYTHNLGER